MSEVVTTNNSVLASFIERAARDTEFDVQKFGELLRMQREVEHDQARKIFNRAMAAAQAEMLPVVRDAKNSHLNNKYAKLETIDAAIRPIYTAHGFSVRYGSAPAPNEGWMRITCTVAHDGGYFEENYLDAPVTTTGSQGGRMAITPVQAIGSTVTYLRRYLLGMVWNTVMADVDDDDDGEGMRRTAAAASTPRAARVTERAPADPLDGPLGYEWLVALKKKLAGAADLAAVETIGGHTRVNDALTDAATPPKVKQQITELLADAYAKHAEATTDAADPDAAGEPELPPVEIAGAKYVGAGD